MNGQQAAPIRILIVDNDRGIVDLVAWFLRKGGYDVHTATSFREARQLIAVQAPHLLLSDLDLGDENALEELPLLSQDGLLPPTLVVSGYLDPLVAAELCALPEVLGTLAKPFDLPVLERRLAICLAEIGVLDPLEAAPQTTGAPQTQPAVVVSHAPGLEACARHTASDSGPTSDASGEDEGSWVEILPLGEIAAARSEEATGVAAPPELQLESEQSAAESEWSPAPSPDPAQDSRPRHTAPRIVNGWEVWGD